jgi:hypothetical protein
MLHENRMALLLTNIRARDGLLSRCYLLEASQKRSTFEFWTSVMSQASTFEKIVKFAYLIKHEVTVLPDMLPIT